MLRRVRRWQEAFQGLVEFDGEVEVFEEDGEWRVVGGVERRQGLGGGRVGLVRIGWRDGERLALGVGVEGIGGVRLRPVEEDGFGRTRKVCVGWELPRMGPRTMARFVVAVCVGELSWKILGWSAGAELVVRIPRFEEKGEFGLREMSFQVGGIFFDEEVEDLIEGVLDEFAFAEMMVKSEIITYTTAPIVPECIGGHCNELHFCWPKIGSEILCHNQDKEIEVEIGRDQGGQGAEIPCQPDRFPRARKKTMKVGDLRKFPKLIFSKLDPGTWYWIRTSCSQIQEKVLDFSDIVAVKTPLGRPDPVKDLEASYTLYDDDISGSRHVFVRLNWKAGESRGAEITEYVVQRSENPAEDDWKIVYRTPKPSCVFSAIVSLDAFEFRCKFAVLARSKAGISKEAMLPVYFKIERSLRHKYKRKLKKKVVKKLPSWGTSSSIVSISSHVGQAVVVEPSPPKKPRDRSKRPNPVRGSKRKLSLGCHDEKKVDLERRKRLLWTYTYETMTQIPIGDDEEDPDPFVEDLEILTSGAARRLLFPSEANEEDFAEEEAPVIFKKKRNYSNHEEKEEVPEAVEAENDKCDEAARCIQEEARRFLGRRKRKFEERNARFIQARVRGFQSRRRVRKLKSMADIAVKEMISRAVRNVAGMQSHKIAELDVFHAATKLQAHYRKLEAQKLFESLKEERADMEQAAVKVQTHVRGALVKKDLKRMAGAAVLIQSRIRTRQEQQRFEQRVQAIVLRAAIRLQTRYRTHHALRQLEQRRRHIVKSIVRVNVTRCGVSGACGIYEQMAVSDAAKYIKSSGDSDDTYLIERSEGLGNQLPIWSLKLVKENGETTLLYANKVEGGSLRPPKHSWQPVNGPSPPPQLICKSSESYLREMEMLNRDSVVITDSGCPEIHGKYFQSGVADNAPQYILTKHTATFAIMRTPYANRKIWLIVGSINLFDDDVDDDDDEGPKMKQIPPTLKQGSSKLNLALKAQSRQQLKNGGGLKAQVSKKVYFVNQEGGNSDEPPIEGWTLAQHGKHPEPLLIKQFKI